MYEQDRRISPSVGIALPLSSACHMARAVLGGTLLWKIKCPQHSYRDCVLESACGSGVQGRGYSFQISHGAVVKLAQQVAKKTLLM